MRLRGRHFSASLNPQALDGLPAATKTAVIAIADQILAGHWEILGMTCHDMEDPDWFYDPVTGRSVPSSDYCFRIDHRSEEVTGNVKQVWELSRHHHITVLAAAYAISHNEAYAERVDRHLRSWWARQPVPLGRALGRAGSNAGYA